MAKVTRAPLKQFGSSGATSNFAEFGSQAASAPVKTKDMATIQSLTAWLNGLQDAVNASNHAPFLEDVNSLFYVLCYQLFYLLQEGIAEWDSTTTYFLYSLVLDPSSGDIYQSLIDNNLNNALPTGSDNGNWKLVYPVRFNQLVGSIAESQIPDASIGDVKLITLSATKIVGDIDQSQIGSVRASVVTGVLGFSQGGTDITTPLIKAVGYTGDGGSSHVIAHGMGATPSLIVISRCDAGNTAPEFWSAAFSTGISKDMTGVTQVNAIKAVNNTNFTLGPNASVNQSGIPYVAYCFQVQT